jgi:aryl-alcohol dehydrogenase-like predicted oxidoreductase
MGAVNARPFGNTDLTVSPLGLGAGAIGDLRVSDQDVDELLSSALDLGITFFDTARSYGASEERIGRWLADEPSRRGRVVLSTKTGYGTPGIEDWTPACVARGVDDALVRMRTDVIDVLHLHSCPEHVLEHAGVIEPLERARAAGKIRVVAYSGENDALAWAASSGHFDALQCSVNLFDQRGASIAAGDGRAVIAKRALGNAPWRFTERPRGDYAETYWERMQAMKLDPRDLSWHELAIRFAAFAPHVSTALVGTTKSANLEANVRAVERGPLPHETLHEIHAAFERCGASWTGEL